MPPALGRSALLVAVAAGSCGGVTDPRPASWPYVSAAITEPSCATVSCHSSAAAVAGLDFSTSDRGFTSLTGLWIWIVDPTGDLNNGCMIADNTVVCPRPRRSLVVPFDPAQSRLVHMLRAENAPRMPPDRPLAEADIRLIESWILSGAQRGQVMPSGQGGQGGQVGQGAIDGGRDVSVSPEAGPDGAASDAGSDSQSMDTGTRG